MTATDFALIGGLVGGLGGAVVFLIKLLVISKDERIVDLIDERDFYRESAIAGGTLLTDFEAWYARRHPPQHH